MGEATSKLTLVHTLSNIKECIKFKRKYIENLRHVLANYYFTTVLVHQGKPTWLRP